MNRFRTKKKGKEEAASRPSVDSEASGPFRMFGKNKKAREDESDKQVDLAAALPSSDDFRTSLLMTGLSARFSMLREQDDPDSKIGKASDDSVLYKRQSRMDFGMNGGLHDIAEVDSIRAPNFGHFDSYQSDDAASTSGSIMSRAKPTDGNNLFGGRQKIYRITAGNTAKDGSMPGRALYEDDVAQSAFQKWRQAERQRASMEENQRLYGGADLDSRAEFDRRRETSSTTSSGPSAARTSTAATSIASQKAPSVKDFPSNATTPNSTSSTPVLERSNVLRTRRLYEQGLTQDMHDHQSSAQSRIDTLSRQRTFGSRIPDLTPMTSSPTQPSLIDRASERRPMLSKASAPNLRSFSPPTTNSAQMSPADSNSKFPTYDQKPAYGAQPPVSPPMSEAGDHPTLAIQPNDRGKATAMGVFTRPAQQYDESKYAQRQRQLQQGRETPTDRHRAESNASDPTSRSRSSSSINRATLEKNETPPVKTEPTVHEETTGTTFFDDGDDDDGSSYDDDEQQAMSVAPQVTLQRPNDQEHPAFRKSALPTPLTLSARNSNDPSPTSEKNEFLDVNSSTIPSEDSPTLPNGSGLSGMVRQHLRNDSTASSIYGPPPGEAETDSQLPPVREDTSPSIGDIGISNGGWGLDETDWKLSFNDGSPPRPHAPPQPTRVAPQPTASRPATSSDNETDQEHDEFARHLADGARRVREKLGTYADSDASLRASTQDSSDKETPRSRSTGLGMLRSKSSRGSLADKKGGSRDPSRSRPSKLDVDAPAMSSAPSSSKMSLDSNVEEVHKQSRFSSDEKPHLQSRNSADKDENAHAGLKAFRQARRDLQKMKEMEVQQRRGAPQKASSRDGLPTQRTTSRDGGPPPVTYNRVPSEEARHAAGSRSGSRASSDRDRSGSETSYNGLAQGPAGRFRKGSGGYDEYQGQINAHRQGPSMRSPRVSGTDMKRSPMTSPEPYGRMASSHGPGAQLPQTTYDPNMASPASTPHGMASSRSGTASPSARPLNTAASTPNLHGGGSAPPLPPINPRRKNVRPGMPSRNSEDLPASSTEGRNSTGMHHSPPHPTGRPPMPPSSASTTNVPGGMF